MQDDRCFHDIAEENVALRRLLAEARLVVDAMDSATTQDERLAASRVAGQWGGRCTLLGVDRPFWCGEMHTQAAFERTGAPS